MKDTVSLCLFCREENASLIKLTLNSSLKQSQSYWSEILVIDLFFQRNKAKGLPDVRYLSLQDPETDPLAYAARHCRSEWLLLAEAGEGVRAQGELNLKASSPSLYYIPVSGEEGEGWEPGFAPRLLRKSLCVKEGEEPGEAAFLFEPLSLSRKYHYTSFQLPPPLAALPPAGEGGRHYFLGEKARRKGNHKKAADFFGRAYLACGQPELKRFFAYKKVSCLFKDHPGERTLQLLARAEREYPFPVEFAYLRGQGLLALRRCRESLAAYTRAAAALQSAPGPRPFGPENFVITTGKARALAALQQKEGSLKTSAHALTCCPGYLPALRLMVKITGEQGAGPRGSRLLYRYTSPLQQGQYACMARLFLEQDRLAEAFTWIKGGLKETPKNQELLYLQASWCWQKGEVQKSLASFKQILRQSTYYRETLSRQCLGLWHVGDFRQVLELLDSLPEGAAPLDKVFSHSLHYHILHRRKSPALQHLLPPLQKNDALFLEFLHWSLYLPTREISRILISLAKTRNQGSLNLRLAKLLAKRGERELAAAFFNKALEKEAYDSESLLIMGNIAMKESLYWEARELFKLALRKYPQDTGIYLAYARALLKEAALTLAEGLAENPEPVLGKAAEELGMALQGLDRLKLDT